MAAAQLKLICFQDGVGGFASNLARMMYSPGHMLVSVKNEYFLCGAVWCLRTEAGSVFRLTC